MQSEIYSFLKSCLQFVRTHHALFRFGAAAAFLLVALAGSMLIRSLTGILHRRLSRSTPRWIQILNESFKEPLIIIIRALLIYLTIRILPIPESLNFIYDLISRIFYAVCLICLGWGFWRGEALCGLLLTTAQNQFDLESNRTMVRFFERIYRLVVVLLTALCVLELFGIPVAGIIAGAGVVGLAVSLACQSTFSSLIAGIALVLEHPFGIGDFVTLGETSGIVEEISFRSTRIRTLDQVLVTIENSEVCSQYIQNMTARKSRLLTFSITLRYDTTVEKIEALRADLTALLDHDSAVVPGSVQVDLMEFAESGIRLDARSYVTAILLPEYRSLQTRINLSVMKIMEEDGCEFAYPSTSVYLETEGRG